MSTDANPELIDEERQMARTTAIGLGIWLALTVAAVAPLLLFGDAVSGLFV